MKLTALHKRLLHPHHDAHFGSRLAGGHDGNAIQNGMPGTTIMTRSNPIDALTIDQDGANDTAGVGPLIAKDVGCYRRDRLSTIPLDITEIRNAV